MSTQIDDASFGHGLHQLGLDEGWWDADGRGGAGLIEGGFVRARANRFDVVQMVSNQVGGFRVRCPACAEAAARAFGTAVTRWRAGGERQMRCPSCGTTSPLEAVDCRPPVGFARSWVHLVDVQRAVLLPAAQSRITEAVGPHRLIGRRPS